MLNSVVLVHEEHGDTCEFVCSGQARGEDVGIYRVQTVVLGAIVGRGCSCKTSPRDVATSRIRRKSLT